MWYAQREQSAGRWRILALWLVYRVFGKHAVNILLWPIFLFIYPWCKPARAALAQYYRVASVPPRPFRHLLAFAQSMMDKTDACTLCRNPPRFTVSGDAGWDRGGVFLVSTHLGCIEVLPALQMRRPTGRPPAVHAFQQIGHDAIFTSLFVKHLGGRFHLHAVEDIGVETAAGMQENIRRGDLVIMAGDRVSAGMADSMKPPPVYRREFFGRQCAFPKGVFVFARLMECPVFAIDCVKTGFNSYEVRTKRLGGDLVSDFVRFLESETRLFPYQWFQFFPFFD